MLVRIWNVLLAIFLLIAAALVIAFAGVRLVGLAPYAVLSGSMEPEYPVGSLIYVKDVSPSSVEVGQAITFRQGSGTLVTHQVYEIDSEQQLFYTQGIANVDSSGEVMHDAAPTPWSSLVGEPVACVPYLGYVNDWITHAPGIYVIVAFVAVVMAVSVALELRRMTLEKRHAEELEQQDEESQQHMGAYGCHPVPNMPYYAAGYAQGAGYPSGYVSAGEAGFPPNYGAAYGAGGYGANGYAPGYGAGVPGYGAPRNSGHVASRDEMPYRANAAGHYVPASYGAGLAAVYDADPAYGREAEPACGYEAGFAPGSNTGSFPGYEGEHSFGASNGHGRAVGPHQTLYGAAPNAASAHHEYPRQNRGFASMNPPQVGSSGRRGSHARPQGGTRDTGRR